MVVKDTTMTSEESRKRAYKLLFYPNGKAKYKKGWIALECMCFIYSLMLMIKGVNIFVCLLYLIPLIISAVLTIKYTDELERSNDITRTQLKKYANFNLCIMLPFLYISFLPIFIGSIVPHVRDEQVRYQQMSEELLKGWLIIMLVLFISFFMGYILKRLFTNNMGSTVYLISSLSVLSIAGFYILRKQSHGVILLIYFLMFPLLGYFLGNLVYEGRHNDT